MRNITAPLLPRRILFDGTNGNQLPLAQEVKEFGVHEIVAGYWRVRKWRLRGNIKLDAGFVSKAWDIDVEFPANNVRPGTIASPKDEEDLVPTQGTSLDQIVEGVSYQNELEGDTFTTVGEYRIEASIFRRVIRNVINPEDFWATRFYAEALVKITAEIFVGTALTPELLIGYGATEAESYIEADWKWVDTTTKVTAAGYANDGTGVQVNVTTTGELTLEASEYWPYADKFGFMPQFNTNTGQPL